MARYRYISTATKLRRENSKKRKRLSSPYKGVIYGLYAADDPLHIRYIGATIKHPHKRLSQHKLGYSSSKVYNWIKEIHDRGSTVQIQVIEEHILTELSKAEIHWTKHYQKLYPDLLNSGIHPYPMRKNCLQVVENKKLTTKIFFPNSSQSHRIFP